MNICVLIRVTALLLLWEGTSSAAVRAGDHVVLIGDSEAYLLGHEFPALARADGVQFDTVAWPGSSITSWVKRGPWEKLDALSPTVVLVSLGANDACVGTDFVRRERENLLRFARRLDRTGAREVYWLGPPRIGNARILPQAKAGTEAFARLIREQTLYPYLDAREVRIAMWNDELHCSRGGKSNGCKTWATWVWREITR